MKIDLCRASVILFTFLTICTVSLLPSKEPMLTVEEIKKLAKEKESRIMDAELKDAMKKSKIAISSS